MAKVIRFACMYPQKPDLQLTSVPATFSNYIWDVDVSTPTGLDQAGRMRWVGQPYNVIELGPIEN